MSKKHLKFIAFGNTEILSPLEILEWFQEHCMNNYLQSNMSWGARLFQNYKQLEKPQNKVQGSLVFVFNVSTDLQIGCLFDISFQPSITIFHT